MILLRYMKTAIVGLFISLGFLVPAFASASATINSVTLNGGSSVQVDPGANITVAVTATLTDGTKWKGTSWGISSGPMVSTCVNTKNAKDGTRNNATGVFVETFTVKAPAQPGLYSANFIADEANNCGKPITSLFQKLQSIRVGTNTVPPVITAHSDMTVQLTAPAAGSVATYVNPAAVDHFNNLVSVSCAPVSGSFFPVGNTTVTCNATDDWGNAAIPSTFVVSVLPQAPPADTTPPVISGHLNVEATTTGTSAIVSYTLPTATDDTDGTVAVTCEPASGSTFSLGTNAVDCSAQDAAGHTAQSTFNVTVTQVLPPGPTLYTMKEGDQSFLCNFNHDWRYCDEDGTWGFTQNPNSGIAVVNLGHLGDGSLQSVTIARDETDSHTTSGLWKVTINCFEDPANTISCADWPGASRFASVPSEANKYWTADFSTDNLTVNPAEYYQLVIDDNGVEVGAYGSESARQPYYLVVGLH
jgi:hypothetical protein